jgi:nucleoredoxin
MWHHAIAVSKRQIICGRWPRRNNCFAFLLSFFRGLYHYSTWLTNLAALIFTAHSRLYTSAHWCPPCRRFTPILAAAYDAHVNFLQEGGGDGTKGQQEEEGEGAVVTNDDAIGEIEVVFVSFDSVKSEYDNYRNTMPWLSVPFANLRKLHIKDSLSKQFNIAGIPALIILDGNSGELLSTNGRGLYTDYFKGEYPTSSSSSYFGGCIAS